MEIICATDNNFVQHCSIMLVSLLTNNKNVNVHILTEGLSIENESIIRTEIENKGGKLSIYKVDSTILSHFPMPKDSNLSHISVATYYRLLITSVLPSTIQKIIYLDCDIIVRNSIEELWDTNLDGFAIAAVKQAGYIDQCWRLKYPEKYGYFNAGVLLINLDYWRKNDISNKLVEYLVNNYDKVVYHDQDAMNSVLHDKCLELSCKWNMTTLYFDFSTLLMFDRDKNGKIINDYKAYKEILPAERKNPTVIHYVSKPKPWQKHCFSKWQLEYFKYAKLTNNFSMISYSKLDNVISLIINRFIMLLYTTYHLTLKRKKYSCHD
jgi:lipopolysaccharide biosynthesis glycosyltransferase